MSTRSGRQAAGRGSQPALFKGRVRKWQQQWVKTATHTFETMYLLRWVPCEAGE